jgi:rfaE bifunctional protein nucleotidyltransferase chain/domain
MHRTSEDKLLTLDGVVQKMNALREEGKAQDDVLVIGINSDASVRAYKSPSRPIIAEQYRARMVAALECVDLVFLFDETDPREWLRRIRPDIHINGAEYGADCIEREVVEAGGGRISLIQPVGGLSTSAVIQRIIAVESEETP